MAEAAHLCVAFLLKAYMIYALAQKLWSISIIFFLIQPLLNVYPMLHLRYARNRLSEFAWKGQLELDYTAVRSLTYVKSVHGRTAERLRNVSRARCGCSIL